MNRFSLVIAIMLALSMALTSCQGKSGDENAAGTASTSANPGTPEVEQDRNRQLLETLASHGDVHSKPRPVDFAASFPTDEARRAFMKEVASDGFLPSANPTWEPEPGQYWCELVKETSIEPATIQAITTKLKRVAEKHGGVYDGWASPVVK